MHKKTNSIRKWEYYLTEEIRIEFKACLYFFTILFFYSMYRLIGGSLEANIIHLAEMIGLTYVMGYVQVYMLSNFDEGEHLGIREIVYVIFCSGIYVGISFWGNWFDRSWMMCIWFAMYMVLTYICAFLVYKIKRNIDEKILNEDLKAFQERRKNEEGN